MFIRIARQNTPPAIALIILTGVLLWLPALYIQPVSGSAVNMPLFGIVSEFIAAYPRLSQLLGLAVLLGEAFLLNYIVYQHQLLTKKSWLPALLTVVLGSSTGDLLQLTAPLLALLPLLGALHLLAGTYRMDTAFRSVFNAGLLISVAGLIYLPAVVFLIIGLAALVVLRPFIWREWIILLFGFSLPWIYASAWFYWNNNLDGFFMQTVLEPIRNRDFFLKLPAESYPLAGVTALLLLTAITRFVSGSGTATLRTKKGIGLMNWFLFIGLLSVLPAQSFNAPVLLLAMPPLAFITANYFLLARRIWMAELLFGLLLLAVVIGYKPWI